MSTLNSYSDSPGQKRFRSDNTSYNDSSGSEDVDHYHKGLKLAKTDLFGTLETKRFDGLQQNERCVVEGRNGSRHLYSTHTEEVLAMQHVSTPIVVDAAAAAALDTNKQELINSDSRFQELNKSYESNILDENIFGMDVKTSHIDNDQESNKDSDNDNEDDDNDNELSYDSDASNCSGEGWKPINSNLELIKKQIGDGLSVKDILQNITGRIITEDIHDFDAWGILFNLLHLPSRKKLDNFNTIDDAIELINRSSNIIVLTGAGVSVSCGIPDFRSRNGIYARLKEDYPDLPNPESMFCIRYFRTNPYPFFKFAKEIYPGQYRPSPSHKFIKYIEMKNKLLRNYSQNIDTLEKLAGIENVITCHGSFATATCTVCGYKVNSDVIRNDIFAQKIPTCSKCAQNSDNDIMAVMKPDIVFFGEDLSDEFHNSMTIDKNKCDLLIVIGSSLKVRPVAHIPEALPENVPQILINRQPLNFNFDVELLGDCDVIIRYLCKRLGNDWFDYCFNENNEDKDESFEFVEPSRYLFQGAELNVFKNVNDDDDDDDDEDDEEDDDDEEENDSIDTNNVCIDDYPNNSIDNTEKEKFNQHEFENGSIKFMPNKQEGTVFYGEGNDDNYIKRISNLPTEMNGKGYLPKNNFLLDKNGKEVVNEEEIWPTILSFEGSNKLQSIKVYSDTEYVNKMSTNVSADNIENRNDNIDKEELEFNQKNENKSMKYLPNTQGTSVSLDFGEMNDNEQVKKQIGTNENHLASELNGKEYGNE